MACKTCKPEITCGDISYAPCTIWEIPDDLQEYLAGETVIVTSSPTSSSSVTIPNSELSGETCATLEDTLADIYNKFGTIEDKLDFSEWTSDCLDFGASTVTLESILTKMDTELCTIKEIVDGLTSICDILDKDITECDLDFTCFDVDNCDNPISITTLKDLLQVLIDKICLLENASS